MIDLKEWNDASNTKVPLNVKIFALLEDSLNPSVIIARMEDAKKFTWAKNKEGNVLCYDIPDGNYHSCDGSAIRYWKNVNKPVITIEKEVIISKIVKCDLLKQEEKDYIIASLKDKYNPEIMELDITEDTSNPKIFSSIKIGNQEWMTENLNFTDEGLGKDHWKNPKNGEVYYSWDAAMRIAEKVPGYHLPTEREWNELAEACGCECENPEEENLGYRDYDNIGELKKKLSIKLCGRYTYGSFDFVGFYGYFWSASESGSGAYFKYFGTGASMSSNTSNKTYGYSVRLVKDSI
jgi:uncharacterized protein (TIGR02145 family)